MKHVVTLSAIAIALTFQACQNPNAAKDSGKNKSTTEVQDPAKLKEAEHKIIEEYVKKKNLKGSYTPSGLFVAINEAGSGRNPDASSIVKVEYTGYFLDGRVFDGCETGKPIEFGLDQVVSGWTEGIPHFKKGGSGVLILPSHIAYGPSGRGPIPPNTVLAFDIRLVDIH